MWVDVMSEERSQLAGWMPCAVPAGGRVRCGFDARTVAVGIHPATLSKRGLEPAVVRSQWNSTPLSTRRLPNP
jgi:hypothetical protein